MASACVYSVVLRVMGDGCWVLGAVYTCGAAVVRHDSLLCLVALVLSVFLTVTCTWLVFSTFQYFLFFF